VRGDRPEFALRSAEGGVSRALQKLDAFAEGAEFVLGHNIIRFDMPRLEKVAGELRMLRLPLVDTLWLSPLCFPRHPYHRLVKHYKDGGLVRTQQNNPESDARLSMQLFEEELEVLQGLQATNPELLAAWHGLCSFEPHAEGLARVFRHVRGSEIPDDSIMRAAVRLFLQDRACPLAVQGLLEKNVALWPLAYALAWLSVAEGNAFVSGNSVMPPWVRHEFPEAGRVVRQLRDERCGDSACPWCAEHHNPVRMLNRWFGYPGFRPVPAFEDGRPMQQAIVETAMAGEDVLGILPTGTGKSLCYQIPALSRYLNTGALTVVISPLVALMADQVAGLRSRGVESCAALNGLLSEPERADVLERVRLGDVAILIVSPEQLRNPGFRKAVEQREVGAWVMDEAHCLSKWGHDFRPDYRYVGRYIRESAGDGFRAPLLCLTATAKPDVVDDIRDYFRKELRATLRVFDGGANRDNLSYEVRETNPAQKLNDLNMLMEEAFGPDAPGGAIIYCAFRKTTEEVAKFLVEKGWAAAHFHAGLSPEVKKATQTRFIAGELLVIAATNAFGMGIDKPDVRLVVHADIPGTLENYVQEAGRAGRDGLPARCVLLYCPQDVENQFGLSALSRLTLPEIQAVLRAARNKAGGKRRPPDRDVELVVTPGELVQGEEEAPLDDNEDRRDTKVRTAISWLEMAKLLSREVNRYEVFPSSLRVTDMAKADERLQEVEMPYRGQLRAIVQALLDAEPDEGVTTDELTGVSRLSLSKVRQAMADLESLGILTDDSRMTALVHWGVQRASRDRFKEAVRLEEALLSALREAAPDLERDEHAPLYLRLLSQQLQTAGHENALPERLHQILRGVAGDGKDEEGGKGSLSLKKTDAETVLVTLRRDWDALLITAARRRKAADLLLAHLLEQLPAGARGLDLQVETTFGRLRSVLESDIELKQEIKDAEKLMSRALLWLHEMEIARLGRGMIVLRPAMTLRVRPGSASFTRNHYAELEDHYREQVIQIHVMAQYAAQGLEDMTSATGMLSEYFQLPREEFLKRHVRRNSRELARQTTEASWNAIVEDLNPVQRRIVADDSDKANVLVLAGPGSGKTRVLVHRVAYLVRVRRENPRGIMALAYNRHAAVEIRRRLRDLIGEDARGVTVMTCHGLAMRVTGTSFAEDMPTDQAFAEVLRRAVGLLRGRDLPPDEADEQRERLLAGFRWILVDEYQDINRDQYDLISALAGRTLNDPERQLSLLAVGDDDQNVYSFAGASVDFIRRFTKDYGAAPEYLVENYRSTANIIAAANVLVAPASNRMKKGHDITVDQHRRKAPPGGVWENADPEAGGRVQILETGDSSVGQAVAVMKELARLSRCAPGWDWSRAAVIAREWKYLYPVRAWCEKNGVTAQMASDEAPPLWHLRETTALLGWMGGGDSCTRRVAALDEWMQRQPGSPWWDCLRAALDAYFLEFGGDTVHVPHFRDWLYGWGRDLRQSQTGLLLLTAHRAKGLEFDHVAVLDGGWDKMGNDEDPDARRRLYYVAMTRARQTLLLTRMGDGNCLIANLPDLPCLIRRAGAAVSEEEAAGLNRMYQRLSMADVDLSYAGRHPDVTEYIREQACGAPLRLCQTDDGWFLATAKGLRMGKLAKKFSPPPDTAACVSATVHAVIAWGREKSGEEYRAGLKCDRWEVLLPELVWEAAPRAPLPES